MKSKSLFFCLFLCAFANLVIAQRKRTTAENGDNARLSYGLKFGVTRSVIENLETTILSEPYFLNYTFKPGQKVGFSGGGFLNYRLNNQIIGINSELTYAQQASSLFFNNFEKDFHYTTKFGYQYFNILGGMKLYPWGDFDNGKGGFNVFAGPQLGLNITSQNITYTSGGNGRLPSFGTDLEQQQQLRNVLKGKTNFGFAVGLGYEFRNFGLVLDARYYQGITDVVETMANSYNFIENKNVNKTFQFSIGWDFSFFNQ